MLLTNFIGHGHDPTVSKCYFRCKYESNRKAMNRNWGNQKANPALKTKTGNK